MSKISFAFLSKKKLRAKNPIPNIVKSAVVPKKRYFQHTRTHRRRVCKTLSKIARIFGIYCGEKESFERVVLQWWILIRVCVCMCSVGEVHFVLLMLENSKVLLQQTLYPFILLACSIFSVCRCRFLRVCVAAIRHISTHPQPLKGFGVP